MSDGMFAMFSTAAAGARSSGDNLLALQPVGRPKPAPVPTYATYAAAPVPTKASGPPMTLILAGVGVALLVGFVAYKKLSKKR